MSGVEFGLAVLAAVDISIRYGKSLIEICTAFKNAEIDIAEKCLQVRYHCTRIVTQLQVLKKVSSLVSKDQLRIHEDMLLVLKSKLQLVQSLLDSCVKVGPNGKQEVKKKKFVLFKRDTLQKAVDELEAWESKFDPLWFLMMKTNVPEIDDALKDPTSIEGGNKRPVSLAQDLRRALNSNSDKTSGIFKPQSGLDSAEIEDIQNSSAKIAQRPGSHNRLVLDRVIPYAGCDTVIMKKDIRDFARKLFHADPLAFGLLSCYGVVQNRDVPGSFTIVFRIPEGSWKADSLRSYLIAGETEQSYRKRQACEKSRKNVRPETILILSEADEEIGLAYLVGFESFRMSERRTYRQGDMNFERNLYRHPNRQGLSPIEGYSMQHDIYSLGVCLLEIGLWKTFIEYDEKGNPQPSDILQLKEAALGVSQALPRFLGTTYSSIVITCLTCLDEDNDDFGDDSEFQDEDGITVGVRYTEKIIMRLNDIFV
ncbi:hypothetical protein P152DRAFT_514695 [Eremomyces bilateralis CBS 781.70]|uniref:Protein kinase domain-containing protein n=1 Tax=Eremomyces bilateralis CBS 781.70 TaxID=1392243 RepID=A0A6G1G2K6_9PEZI|nr:uncharacterized protein P152DRAFT_514695 [Eremomyces bilateralis CBS 781.70]KAF1812039.1 hypothetical protein P152DRAFT_514695 [Eremomyces bilateralis CBS 781.70]